MRRAVLATCFLIAPIASLAQDELFVSNSNSNAITVYARTATGNTPPIRVLAGPATGLSSPAGLAVDLVNDELYVVNLTAQSVTVYPRTATGNSPPLRTVSGNLTTLDGPRGISVDPANGEFSVANRSGFSVTTWSRTANGNVAPLRALRTPMAFSNPWGVLIDVAHDEIAVANNGNFISVFPRPGDGMVPPSRTFSGSNTGFNNGPVGIALDEAGDEYVVTTPNFPVLGQWGILWFPRLPGGNVQPNRAIGGDAATTQLVGANGVAVDARRGEIFVANSIGNSIAVHSRFLTGVAPPQRLLTGAATQINNPQFVAVTSSLFADGFE
jgi:DNA-binding beta-propeller fold protein YncE